MRTFNEHTWGLSTSLINLCNKPIDYSIRDHLHPMAFQIDHIIPRSKGGPNLLENLAASHRQCNRERSDKPIRPSGVIFITERNWTP